MLQILFLSASFLHPIINTRFPCFILIKIVALLVLNYYFKYAIFIQLIITHVAQYLSSVFVRFLHRPFAP